MNVPASAPELFTVFTRYNTAVWPAQIGLLALALGLLVVVVRGRPGGARVVYGGLALLWVWCGAVFFLAFYARYAGVAPLAYGMATAFVLQGALFARAAAVAGGGTMALRADVHGMAAAALIGYALLIYPLLASALGQHYPGQPTFGAPCPLTIFTFGLLLLAAARVPGHLLAIPFVWAVLGIFPVLRFGVVEDIGLIAAGLVALPLILGRNRGLRSTPGADPGAGVGETPAPPEGIRRLH